MKIDSAEMMNLRSDAKMLKDISSLFEMEGSFKVLPSVLTNIADDILKAISGGEKNERSDC